MSMPGTKRAGVAGVAAIAAYLAMAAWGTGGLMVRPLYDGTQAPPPYKWVNPPPDLKEGNEKPEAALDAVPFVKGQSEAYSVQTPDGQAAVTLPPNAVAPKAGEARVRVTITPLDPATVAEPPAGMDFDGNAYRFDFTYESSGEPAALLAQTCPPPNSGQPSQCISVALRHPISANALYRRDGAGRAAGGWTKMEVLSAPFQLFGDSTKAGIFVAAGPQGEKPSKLGDYIAIGGGVLAALIAIVLGRVIPKQRRRRARKAQARARAQRLSLSKKKRR